MNPSRSEKGITLSVCVPAFNEESSLKEAVVDLISQILPAVNELEVIVVDDASIDSTPQIAEDLAEEFKEVKVIHHKKNSGIGACFRSALELAEKEYFSWFPADYENDPQELLECLHSVKEDRIVTSHHQGEDPRPFIRRFISRSYTWFLNRCFNLNLKYYNGLTIFPTTLLKEVDLICNGFTVFAEAIIKVISQGCKVVELSAPLKKRIQGKSKAFTISSFIRMGRESFYLLSLRRRLSGLLKNALFMDGFQENDF